MTARLLSQTEVRALEMDRNLDSAYFRVKRGGKFEAVCFSDLTESEKDEMLTGRTEEWLRSLCKILATKLREMGDQFDIQGIPGGESDGC